MSRVELHRGEVDLSDVQEALVIRPGDTLLVRVAPGISADNAERLHAAIAEHVPDVAVLILAVDGMAVFRPDEVAEADRG